MFKRLLSLLLTAAMVLSLCACGSGATATTMKLARTEGTAHVLDENAEEQPIVDDMNLYNGYGVDTESASYAWVDLDSVKLLKLDEESDISITKDGNKLRVDLKSGSMFFCVLEPLSDEEELEFATTNMAMTIRGTTGVLRVVSDSESSLVLIEGEAEVSVPDGSAQTVTTGQVAQTVVDETGTTELTVRDMYPGDVPEFAREMIEESADIQEKITSGGGDLETALSTEPVTEATEETTEATEALSAEVVYFNQAYAEVFAGYRAAISDYAQGILWTEEQCDEAGVTFVGDDDRNWVMASSTDEIGIYYQDLDGDGSPELFIMGKSRAADYENDIWGLYTLRDGKPVNVINTNINIYLGKGTLLSLCKNGVLKEVSTAVSSENWAIYQLEDGELEEQILITRWTINDSVTYDLWTALFGGNGNALWGVSLEEVNAFLESEGYAAWEEYVAVDVGLLPFPEE